MSTTETHGSRPPRPTDAQRADRLYAAVDQFEYGAELAKHVYHLGTPRFGDSCPTASLSVGEDGQAVFTFNRTYFDGLGHDEMVFVVLHEALHYAFCHPLRRHDRTPAFWNVACDLVVNAFLLQKVGLAGITTGSFREFLTSAITFEALPIAPAGHQLSLTAEQVYDLLTGDTRAVQGNDANSRSRGGDGRRPAHGSKSNEAGDAGDDAQASRAKASNVSACDEHEWSELDCGATAGARESIRRLAEQVQRVVREWLPSWGDEACGEWRAIGEVHPPVRVAWDFVLCRRISSCVELVIEQRWAPPNRKTAWLYPDLLLPTDHDVERRRRSVLLALDASGSIEPAVLDRLAAVARSIPTDQVQLTTISFDSAAYHVDLWAKPPRIRGGGGTSFDAVERFAVQLDRYPDLIVVLTDGQAPRPTVRQSDRWFWLITEGGTTSAIEGIGRHCLIEGSYR